MTKQSLTILSDVIGYSYTVAWGISFLGQIHLNWKLKNVEGCNLDFVIYNLTGFTFYTIYNWAGHFLNDPKEKINGIDINDLVFSLWAWCMTVITLIQCFLIYPRKKNKVSIVCICATPSYWCFVLLWAILTAFTHTIKVPEYADILYMMSYVKMFISLTKYIPQAYWNYKRKSTEGWSILNVMLDFTGGSLSFLQMVVDGFNGKSPFSGGGLNICKFGLSVESIVFDVFFMIQHYILYKNRDHQEVSTGEQQEVLINSANSQEN